MKFRKKPVIIEAFQWTAKGNFLHWKSLPKWLIEAYEKGDILPLTDGVEIQTLEGRLKANIGDWIIQGVNGEIYPCKPDIFEKTYERVEENLKCRDCKQFIEPDECKDRATVSPDSPACDLIEIKSSWLSILKSF